MNYVTLLKKDTGYDNTHEIRAAMLCRETWSGVPCCVESLEVNYARHQLIITSVTYIFINTSLT